MNIEDFFDEVNFTVIPVMGITMTDARHLVDEIKKLQAEVERLEKELKEWNEHPIRKYLEE